MTMLPERIPQIDVSIGDQANAGQLLKTSTYEFRYLDASTQQPSIALLMPAAASPVLIPHRRRRL